MAVQKIFMNLVDLTIPGLGFTTDTTFFDPTRSSGSFIAATLESASIDFPAITTGTTTWFHAVTVFGNTQSNLGFNGAWEVKVPDGTVIARMDISAGLPQFTVVGDATSSTVSQSISANVQYIFDMSVDVTPTTITVSGYINSALIGTVSAPNTTGSRPFPTRLTLNNGDNAGNLYYSEGVIASDDTRGFRVRELRPTSFGVDQAWTGDVNNVVDNDLATGISTPTDGARTSFGVSNLQNVSAGDIVNRLVAQTYAQRGATGLTRFNHYFRYPDDTREDGGDITVGTTGDWYLTEFLTNPKTTLPWTPEELSGIQIGVRGQT